MIYHHSVPLESAPEGGACGARSGHRKDAESAKADSSALFLPAGRQVRLCGEPDLEAIDQKESAQEEE
jgi:hypothetical protein